MRKHSRHRNHTNPNHHIRPMSPDRVERILYGDTLPNMHTKERLQQARKENEMPDIKTAMEKALSTTINEWANDDKPQQQTNPKEKTMPNPNPVINYEKHADGKIRFVETVGVTRAVFDQVHNNPGTPRQQVTDVLIAKGFKKSSIGSLITQNVRVGIFRQDGHGRLYSEVKEYVPIPSTKQRMLAKQAEKHTAKREKLKAKLKVVKEKQAGIAALAPVTTSTSSANFDMHSMLNTLSIMQARALYDELRKVFGG
jgi:hypothetical protein